MLIKRLALENVRNCRDLGGIMVSSGEIIKPRRYLRSGNVSRATTNDIKNLKAYGLKHVIDLRTIGDTKEVPSVFSDVDGVKYHLINLYGEEREEILTSNYVAQPENFDKLSSLYRRYIDNKEAFRKIFELFLEYKDDTFLYHCGIGKDRTGMVSMVIQGVLGVELVDIVAGYVVSKTYLRDDLSPLEFSYPEEILNSDSKNILYANNYLLEKYGSYKGYFLELGFSESDYEAFRKSSLQETKF